MAIFVNDLVALCKRADVRLPTNVELVTEGVSTSDHPDHSTPVDQNVVRLFGLLCDLAYEDGRMAGWQEVGEVRP